MATNEGPSFQGQLYVGNIDANILRFNNWANTLFNQTVDIEEEDIKKLVSGLEHAISQIEENFNHIKNDVLPSYKI